MHSWYCSASKADEGEQVEPIESKNLDENDAQYDSTKHRTHKLIHL